jgi:hypothetical protein
VYVRRAVCTCTCWPAATVTLETSDAVKLSSCSVRLFGGVGEGDVFVVMLAGGEALVQAAEEAAEQVALGGGVPVAGVAAPVVVGAGAGWSARRTPRCTRRR